MRIAVVGGAGVFGEKLCRLLRRDDHEVWVVGRRPEPLETLAAQIGAKTLVLDRAGDLSPLADLDLDAVIDAAGPFHGYGEDRYRLPEFCIAHGINALDLADDADYCAGIAALDDSAKAAGVFVLSGVSSVPAVSSAAVDVLASDMDHIRVIDTAILPGNRAPRGRSVMASILNQVGTQIPIFRAGAWRRARSWSSVVSYDLSDDIRRWAYLIEVPDLKLFPDHFKADTVLFRAGLELGIMSGSLAAWSWLRGWLGIALPGWMLSPLVWASKLLYPFGTDRGGMIVRVLGDKGGAPAQREWRLVAEQGEGPFVPTVAARAVMRDPQKVPPGARPCLGDVPLADIKAAMSDLAITTEIEETPVRYPFHDVLGANFDRLPAEVRHTHTTDDLLVLAGRAKITRGRSLLSRLAALAVGLPQAVDDTPVRVTKYREGASETWVREFGEQAFSSVLSVSKRGPMIERFGLLAFELGLHVTDDALHFPVLRGWAAGIPLPSFLRPQSVAREYVADGKFHFDVQLLTPFGAEIIHYQGWLEPVLPDKATS